MISVFGFLFQQVMAFFYLRKRLDSNVIVFNSSSNRNYNFNSKYLFEFFFDNTDYDVYFVLNDRDKFDSVPEKYKSKIIDNKTLENKKIILNAKVWVCSTLEQPLFLFLKNRDRVVYHLGHGVPLKNIGYAEENISILRRLNRWLRIKNLTHVTCYSAEFSTPMRMMFGDAVKYVPLGQPRNDFLMKGFSLYNYIRRDANYSKVIVYSPTWRPYSVTKFFPFDDFDKVKLKSTLDDINAVLILREHPYNKALYPDGLLDIDRVFSLNYPTPVDISELLGGVDILLTDYSSVYIDALANEKTSFLFLPYDFDIYKEKVGFSLDYNSITPGDKIMSMEDFITAISGFNGNDYYSDRSRLNRLFNVKYAGNCVEHYDYIEKVIGD